MPLQTEGGKFPNMADNPFRHQPSNTEDYLSGMWEVQQEILARVIDQNHRTTKLEAWQSNVIAKQREDEAYLSGLGEALITKKQWRRIAALLGGVSLIASTVGALVGVAIAVY